MEPPGQVQAVLEGPFDLQRGEPVPDAVGQVQDEVLVAAQGVELLAHRVRQLGGLGVALAGGQDAPVQGEQRPAAFGQLREDVLVAVLDVAEELVLRKDVTLVRVGQDARELGGPGW
jgi:hypothetical protein